MGDQFKRLTAVVTKGTLTGVSASVLFLRGKLPIVLAMGSWVSYVPRITHREVASISDLQRAEIRGECLLLTEAV